MLRIPFLRRCGAEGGGGPMHELGFQVAGSSQKLKKHLNIEHLIFFFWLMLS